MKFIKHLVGSPLQIAAVIFTSGCLIFCLWLASIGESLLCLLGILPFIVNVFGEYYVFNKNKKRKQLEREKALKNA